tara:strand:- start:2174 stop:3007 length:834 start_codon:yes stop_codon:yes gene_type:complete
MTSNKTEDKDMRSVVELMDLRDKRALITGGSGHIGSVVAQTLIDLGATISILDLDIRACKKQAQLFNRVRAESAYPFSCDLRDERRTRLVVNKVIEKMGGLDILVHCAAYVGTTQAPGWAVPFEEQTVGAWEDATRVNLTSVFVMIQEAKKALSESGSGSVILFSSIYGFVGPDFRLYDGTEMANPVGGAVSKGGLIQLTRYFATMLAPRIRVNAISSGGVRRNQPKVFQERYVARTPLGRMAVEEDMKGAVAYLASDLSAYVTGHNLVVDGGWTAW